jgi:protein SCO1/2
MTGVPASVVASVLASVLASGLAICGAGGAETPPRRSAAELMDVLMWNREPVGGPFSLIDQTGRRRSDAEFRGKLLMVYFGFSYCPDICPTDLQEIGRSLDLLGPAGEAVQPVFITLDPERDSPAHLGEYLPLFHPRFVGLTGSSEEIRAIADAYKVFYDKVGTRDGAYTVDHTAFVYLIGRDGGYLGFFPPNTPAERMVAIVRPHLAGN